MRIGVIQASSQASKNQILYAATEEAAGTNEVLNFGCFEGEQETYSYVETALSAGLLLASKAVDFVVTGCSSGQGMMLACNSLPGVMCGYVPTPQDAFLFGRINDGNAVSVPLGLNYGWLGEMNLRYTLQALFEGPFGTGYPEKDAQRKMRDTALVKTINAASKISMIDLLSKLDRKLRDKVLNWRSVMDQVLENGTESDLVAWLRANGALPK